MIEETLIKLLSDESEKAMEEEYEQKLLFDNEICAWKHIRDQLSPEKYSVKPAGFRIRVVESRGSLTRSASSKNYTGTVSSSNESRNTSPQTDSKAKRIQKFRKRISSFNCNTQAEKSTAHLEQGVPANIIRIYKPPVPRRNRKPIKVFRLPRVEQGEEE